MSTDKTKFKSLADYLLGWTWDKRPASNPFWDSLKLKGGGTGLLDRWGKELLRKDLMDAENFRLSDDYLLRTMDLAHIKEPSEMLAVAKLARLPFRKPLLVEWDAGLAQRHRVELGTAPPMPKGEEIEGRDGLLFLPFDEADEDADRNWIAIHVSDTDGGMPVWPAACALGLKVSEKLGAMDAASAATQFRASAWGYYRGSYQSGLRFTVIDELLAMGSGCVDPYFTRPFCKALIDAEDRAQLDTSSTSDRLMLMMQAAAQENAGTLRHACAILASLNTVPTTRAVRRPSGTFQHRFRNLPHLAVTDVEIDARPGHAQAVYERSLKDAIHHHRLHDVRGHWRDFSRGAAPLCTHEIVESDDFYALCGKCQRLLRWVVPHERGDESLGRVIHDHYTVQ